MTTTLFRTPKRVIVRPSRQQYLRIMDHLRAQASVIANKQTADEVAKELTGLIGRTISHHTAQRYCGDLGIPLKRQVNPIPGATAALVVNDANRRQHLAAVIRQLDAVVSLLADLGLAPERGWQDTVAYARERLERGR